MKRTCIFTAAVLALAGCAKVVEQDTPEGKQITITASFVDEQSRTTLVDGGTDVYWEPSDEIKVFYGSEGGRFTSTITEYATTSDFSGSLSFVFGVNEGVGGSKSLWAVYPYRSDATSDGESVTTLLPSEQTGRAGSFAKGLNIALAKSSSFNMGFYNVCGGVRFSVTRDNVQNVVFEALNGESVVGKVKLGFSGNIPEVQEVVEGVDSIVLTAPAGGSFETGKWYYIVALPGTLSGGFKMTFNTETKYAVLKSTDSRTISRSKFGSLADADDGLIYKDKGTPEPTGDYIVFKDPIAKYACIYAKYDTDNDGEISYDEAAAVTSISGLFSSFNTVTSFDELKYFTGITGLSSALKGLTALKSTTIPAEFTSIEDNAFDGCTALDSISFAGNSINSFGYRSFYKCSSLKEVKVPSGVKSLKKDTFSECSALASVSLPASLESLGDYIFNNCSSLVSVNLPSNVTAVGQYAFCGCSSLKSIEMYCQMTAISTNCFKNCSSLESVGLPSGLESIGSYAFSGCTSLKAVDFPSKVKEISDYAFQNCKSLKSVSVPNTVTSFGNYVFSGCSSLESAVLPSGLTSIHEGTFSDCSMLNQFSFPESVASIGNSAFSGCYFVKNKVSKIQLPTSITSIGSNAFTRVLNVLIPSSSPVSISSGAFGDYTKLYVNSSLVGVYKVMTNWSAYADRIFSISEYEDPEPSPAPEGAVDMGLSVYWASCNIGATSPEDYGRHFAWGDIVGQTWNGSFWSGGGFYDYPAYELDENNNLKPEYDAAHVNLGGNWRMPTHSEQQELKDLCEWTWTQMNGVYGREVKSRINGNTIFLPAAGNGSSSKLYNAGSCGSYWSSTFLYDNRAWFLSFRSDYVSTSSNGSHSSCHSVRPVCD